MTSRRAAPLASRFPSRQSPPAPRPRWAAALAIAYLAVAGCAAQADNAHQAAAQAASPSALPATPAAASAPASGTLLPPPSQPHVHLIDQV